jgi:hypothetical protein
MPETFEEQLSRVRMILAEWNTGDLSPEDLAALRALLYDAAAEDHKAMEILRQWIKDPRGLGFLAINGQWVKDDPAKAILAAAANNKREGA